MAWETVCSAECLHERRGENRTRRSNDKVDGALKQQKHGGVGEVCSVRAHVAIAME